MQVALTGYIDVPPDRLKQVMAALPDHITRTLQEPGCMAFSVTPDPDQPGRLNVAERFASRADFDAHQARTKASDWADVTAGIPRHYAITEHPA